MAGSQGCFKAFVIVTLSVIALAAMIFLAFILLMGKACADVGSNMAERERAERAALADLEFENVEVTSDGHFMKVEGSVRNTGTTVVKFAKVRVEWKDAAGQVIDTDSAYAIGGEGLEPGQSKRFRVMTENDSRMRSASYHFIP